MTITARFESQSLNRYNPNIQWKVESPIRWSGHKTLHAQQRHSYISWPH